MLTAKLLRAFGTVFVIVFAAQMILAVAGEFFPTSHLGRVLYPLYLTTKSVFLPYLGWNLLILAGALGSIYWADKIERELSAELIRARRPEDDTEKGVVHLHVSA